MRWLGRLLVAGAFCGCLFLLLIPALADLWQQARLSKSNMDQARANTFFSLNEEQWLTFDVPKGSSLFRVYSHAALTPGAGDDFVDYTLGYQWLDEGGSVLEERQHHITTRAASFVPQHDNAADSETPIEIRFYDHRRSRPSRDHALYFNPSTHPEARFLRLRVDDKDSSIDQIGIRPFQQEHRPRERVDLTWQRMSERQRESLSSGALYPGFLLSDYERKNLLSSFWKPIGPLGVLNTDYQINTLYQLDSNAPIPAPDTPPVDGLFASGQQWITVVLPEDNGRYRIEWNALLNGDTPGHLQLHWQGVDIQQQRQWELASGNPHWEGPLEGGLLQLAPDQPGIMKLYQWQGEQWRDITPDKRYVRTFLCSPDAGLAYILAPGARAQELKVDARAYYREDQPPSPVTPAIRLSLEDDTGQTLYEHTIELPDRNYPYQQFSDAAAIPSHILEPLSNFLDASPDSQRLRLECNAPSLVSVYSRPWRHPVSRSLPAHENYWHSYEERDPAWFTLLPENVSSLIRQKRYFSLLWYFRPMSLDRSLTNGDFSWQAIPADNPETLELQVFSSHAGDNKSRMDARGSAYQPLVGPATVIFAGRSNEQLVQASAVYLQDKPQPQAIQVWIDSALVLETTIAGSSGRIQLPLTSAGQHHIEIRSEAVSWYLNKTAQAGQTHILRSVYSMIQAEDGGASLEFRFNSSGAPQQLGLWLYTPMTVQAVNCSLRLVAKRINGVKDNYSFLDFRYHLAAEELEQSYVLQRKNTKVRGPARLTVPLDVDLPAQTITARLRCDQRGVLVSAGLISRGLSAFRFFEERHEAG